MESGDLNVQPGHRQRHYSVSSFELAVAADYIMLIKNVISIKQKNVRFQIFEADELRKWLKKRIRLIPHFISSGSDSEPVLSMRTTRHSLAVAIEDCVSALQFILI